MKTDPNIIPLVFFGTPSLVVPILQKLTEHFQVQGVVTAPDKPVGRKQILTSSPVAETAQKYGIPVLKPEKLDEEFIKNHLPFLNADLYIVAAYGKLRPYLNKVWLADFDGICSTDIWALRAKEGIILPQLLGAILQQSSIVQKSTVINVNIEKNKKSLFKGSLPTGLSALSPPGLSFTLKPSPNSPALGSILSLSSLECLSAFCIKSIFYQLFQL